MSATSRGRTRQREWKRGTPVPALRPLAPFVGRWKVTLRWGPETYKLARGPREFETSAKFHWISGGQFLLGSLRIGFPTRWIFAGNDATHEFTVVASDSRGVARVYAMSLKSRRWKMSGAAAAFQQRAEGQFNGSKKMVVRFDRSMDDGRTWIRDADAVFTRVA